MTDDARGPIVVSARIKASGGRAVPPDSQWGSLAGYRELTLLVHGYNQSEASVESTWKDTYRQLRELMPHTRFRNIALYYWPGDFTSVHGVSTLAYFSRIDVAQNCGRDLADLLTGLSGHVPKLRVWLIGHSLGCRLVLETVRRLRNSHRVEVAAVLLMAAAVPEGLCEEDRRYAGRVAPTEVVLHSSADTVLRDWFEKGQSVARWFRGELDPGPHRGAVGLSGQPGHPRWDGTDRSCGLDHNEYWTDPEACSQMATLHGGARVHHPAVHRSPRRHPGSRRPAERRPAVRHRH